TAKTLKRQMINSMSTKMEIGSPMASMYVLGNPDHYCSHKYVNFTWCSYVTFVKNYWRKLDTNMNDDRSKTSEDLLTIRNQDGSYVACSVVDDYRFRPLAYESLNLYEWVQCSEKKARTRREPREFEEYLKLHSDLNEEEMNQSGTSDDGSDEDFEFDDLDSNLDDFIEDDLNSEASLRESGDTSDDEIDWSSEEEDELIVEKQRKREAAHRIPRLPFLPAHLAAFKTHSVHCDFRKLDNVIPNFIGGAIPRADKGDREYYCMTIMTLFKPWR
ncbi:hypothetical protein B0H16DRAFT_1273780, partial [Mycena metata]